MPRAKDSQELQNDTSRKDENRRPIAAWIIEGFLFILFFSIYELYKDVLPEIILIIGRITGKIAAIISLSGIVAIGVSKLIENKEKYPMRYRIYI